MGLELDENKFTTLPASKEELKKEFDAVCDQVEMQLDDRSRRVLSLLIEQQKLALDILDGVNVEVEQKSTKPFLNDNYVINKITNSKFFALPAFSGAFSVLMMLGSFTLEYQEFKYYSFVIAFVLLIRALAEKMLCPKIDCSKTIYITQLEKDHFCRQAKKCLIENMQTIINIENAKEENENYRSEQNIAEAYQIAYQASYEHPEDFKPLLDRLQQMLWNIGLDVIPYSSENSAYFEVSIEDCPSQVIYPAICDKKKIRIIRKGYYLQNKA